MRLLIHIILKIKSLIGIYICLIIILLWDQISLIFILRRIFFFAKTKDEVRVDRDMAIIKLNLSTNCARV